MSKTIVAQCPHCGTLFERRPSQSKVCCSRSCGTKYRPKADPRGRFWAKVEKTESCWLWRGGLSSGRYGQFHFMGGYAAAHRVAWFLEHGDWPPGGLFVCHTCDEPKCVRPSHLFLGTHTDNMVNRSKKLRGPNRLTPAQVTEARSRCAAGESHTAIANSLGVGRKTISHIANGATWKWLTE